MLPNGVIEMNHQQTSTLSWPHWRSEILCIIQREYGELFPELRQDDVDWDAWHPLYANGLSAESAVQQALSSFSSKS